MKEQSSDTSPIPLAHYDPDTCCWKMSQATLLSEEPESLRVLPKWGTTRGGALYERQTPAHPTNANDGFASLPTPTCSDRGNGKSIEEYDEWANAQKSADGRPAVHGKSLVIEVKRLPTPRSAMGESRNNNLYVRPLNKPQNLENTLARILLPTPRSFLSNMKALKIRENHHNNLEEILAEVLLPTPTSTHWQSQLALRGDPCRSLNDAISHVLLPTPAARDHKDTGENTDYEKLAKKSKLTGVIMTLPSNNGGKSSGDQPPTPPTAKE